MRIFRRLAYSLGIKLRLLILVLLAVAPLVALIAWDVVDDRRTAIEQAGIAALQSARLAASRQSDALNEAITLTEGMRSIPTITVEGGDACRAQVAHLQKLHPHIATIGVLRLDGMVMCHNLLPTAQLVGHQDLLKDALRDDAPAPRSGSSTSASISMRSPNLATRSRTKASAS